MSIQFGRAMNMHTWLRQNHAGELENTKAAFDTAVAVAEWIATYSAKHSGPFELHTLLD